MDLSPKTQSLFKKQIIEDVNDVFFNLDEFVDKHIIDDVEMDVLIDENELIEREKKMSEHMNGIYLNQILIYVKKSQFGNRPKLNHEIEMDGRPYMVKDCTEEMGIYAITLERHRG